MAYSPRPPFWAYSGSKSPKILLLGEAFGRSEAELHKPFVGESGKELWRMLGEAMPSSFPELHREASESFRWGSAWVRPREKWLEACGLGMTQVLNLQLAGNKIESVSGSKTEVGGKDYHLPSISHGKYLRPEYLPELDRLFEEIRVLRPNLVVCLGNTASWAMLQATNIGNIRGNVAESRAESLSPRVKCLPTYHPAGVLRNWSWRTVVVADLMKAAREGEFPEIRRPQRTVVVNPSLEEVVAWTEETLASPPRLLSPDIETVSGMITCIGFARSRSEALVIPFLDKGKPFWQYWESPNEEIKALDCARRLLESDIPKVGQNFIYDLQYLYKYGIRPKNCLHDTMLLHHSLFPEMKKGLGFLGSIYTSEASWKLMARKRADDKTVKADE